MNEGNPTAATGARQQNFTGHFFLCWHNLRFRSGEVIAHVVDDLFLVEHFRSVQNCGGPMKIVPVSELMRCEFFESWADLDMGHYIASARALAAFADAARRA